MEISPTCTDYYAKRADTQMFFLLHTFCVMDPLRSLIVPTDQRSLVLWIKTSLKPTIILEEQSDHLPRKRPNECQVAIEEVDFHDSYLEFIVIGVIFFPRLDTKNG